MSTKLISLSIVILSTLHSCNPNQNATVKEINIPAPTTSEALSTLIDSYIIIPLDRKPEAYIANAARTIYTDSLILIKNESNQSILIFKNEGTFLNSISKRGRGPREYIYISDFTYDPTDKVITIYDGEKAKMYSLNGEFISESNLGFRAGKTVRLDGEHTILEKVIPSGDTLSDYYIRVVNEAFNTTAARCPIKPLSGPGFGVEGQTNRTMLNGDHAYFFSYFGDTVYHINKSSITPAFAFDYKKDIITIHNGSGVYDVDPENSLRYLSYFETGDLNLLFFKYQNKGYCFAFNSSNNNSRLYNSNFIIRDSYKNHGYILTDAGNIIQFTESADPLKERCLNLETLDSVLNETNADFQCIVKIKFKEL